MKHALFYILAIVLFFSCGNDDDMFPNGSRELTIEFKTFTNSGNNFCYVTDEGGRVWWDSVYMSNQSTRSIQVPLDMQANITFGRRFGNGSDAQFFIETFRNVEDYFSEGGILDHECALTTSRFGIDQKQFIIEQVPTEIEIVQSGISRVENELYNSAQANFNFSARPTTYGLADNDLLYLVVRELSSGLLKGLMVKNVVIEHQDTIYLDYQNFEETNTHTVSLPNNGFWKYSLRGTSIDVNYIYKARELISLPQGLISNSLTIYLPRMISKTNFGLDVYEQFSTLNKKSEVVYYGEMLPTNIDILPMELTDLGTNVNELKYTLDNFVSFTSSVLRYEDFSTWNVHQVDGTKTDFVLPKIPNNVTRSFPELINSVHSPISLQVTAFSLTGSHSINAIKMNSRRVISQIKCQAHQNSELTKLLP